MYKTLDELLKEDILEMTEYEGFYYVIVKEDEPTDEMWEVNKETGKAEYMQYPEYIGTIKYKAKPVDPDTLRRVL